MASWRRLDEASAAEARELLRTCCGSTRWVQRMEARRPFGNQEALLSSAAEVWWSLGEDDWRQAFAHHPKIGDRESLRKRFASTASWAADEQKGAIDASESVLDALARGNRDYEEKFGYIFIVCATGKSAPEMLALLEARLPNDPEPEMKNAAEEQMKITRLRLEKLLEDR